MIANSKVDNQSSEQILEILSEKIFAYGNSYSGGWLEEKIKGLVSQEKKIEILLPAFPGKSPNTTNKTLSHSPDFAELYALRKLRDTANNISRVYAPGAKVIIFSDYHTFSKYVGIDENNYRNYYRGLERMIDYLVANEFIQLQSYKNFFHLKDAEHDPHAYYEHLIQNFGYDDLGTSDNERIRNSLLKKDDEKISSRYLGLKKFMAQDQEEKIKKMKLSNSQKNKYLKEASIGMMSGGVALDRFLSKYYSDDMIRVSIHLHPIHSKKIALNLLDILPENKEVVFLATPWHTSPLFDTNLNKIEFKKKVNYFLSEDNKSCIVSCDYSMDSSDEVKLFMVKSFPEKTVEKNIYILKDKIENKRLHYRYQLNQEVISGSELLEHPSTLNQLLDLSRNPEDIKIENDEKLFGTILWMTSYHERGNKKPFLLLKFSSKNIDFIEAIKLCKISVLRLGLGLIINIPKKCNLSLKDFPQEIVSNCLKQFGLVILKGAQGIESVKDFENQYATRGKFINWDFGPTHVIDPSGNNGFVDSYQQLNVHFDLILPPSYMKIDQEKYSYDDYIPSEFALFCKVAPKPGDGRTTFVNSAMAVDIMPTEMYKKLQGTILTYYMDRTYFGGNKYSYQLIYFDKSQNCETLLWQEMREQNKDSTYRAVNEIKSTKCKNLNVNDLENDMLELAKNPRIFFKYSYDANDLVLVNNRKNLHGRDAFYSKERIVYRIQLQPDTLNSPYKSS